MYTFHLEFAVFFSVGNYCKTVYGPVNSCLDTSSLPLKESISMTSDGQTSLVEPSCARRERASRIPQTGKISI